LKCNPQTRYFGSIRLSNSSPIRKPVFTGNWGLIIPSWGVITLTLFAFPSKHNALPEGLIPSVIKTLKKIQTMFLNLIQQVQEPVVKFQQRHVLQMDIC